MSHADQFRRCLEEGDVPGLRAIWAEVAPHLPQPSSDGQATIAMHRARTETASIPLRLRAYSHAWLLDHKFPSGLPDDLKPKAERICPRVVEAVGIAVNARSALLKPACAAIQKAMSDAVEDAYADGRTDTHFVKARMAEARAKTVTALFG